MQKIQSYLYPNRIIVTADLAGFTTEYKNVYQRTVKIYQGVDNVIEFDIKNADQKRVDLTTLSNIHMNVMDQSGNALPHSPYPVTPDSPLVGISTATIPAADLEGLDHQFFNYSLTAVKGSATIPLYVDSRFGAVGRIEFITNAVPKIKQAKIFDRFSGEINYMGNVIGHSSVVATKSYEAIAETVINFDVYLTNFIGELYIEGTEDSTISINSFTNAPKIAMINYPNIPGGYTGMATFDSIPIGTYNYIRVSWTYPDVWQYGAQLTTPFGTVDKITTNFGTAPC